MLTSRDLTETSGQDNRLPGGIAYAISDAGLDYVPKWQRTVRTDEKPYQAGTLAQLAELIGVSADHLERTVAEFKPLEKDGLATRGLHPPNSKCSHHREATLPRMADQLCQLLHTRRTSLQHLGADR